MPTRRRGGASPSWAESAEAVPRARRRVHARWRQQASDRRRSRAPLSGSARRRSSRTARAGAEAGSRTRAHRSSEGGECEIWSRSVQYRGSRPPGSRPAAGPCRRLRRGRSRRASDVLEGRRRRDRKRPARFQQRLQCREHDRPPGVDHSVGRRLGPKAVVDERQFRNLAERLE